MDDDFKYCTSEQRITCITISKFYDKLKNPYLGAIIVLAQKDNPERLVQFACSLREVIDLLTRKNMKGRKRKQWMDNSDRKEELKKIANPSGSKSNIVDSDYEILINKYKKFNEIVHHNDTIKEKEAKSDLDDISMTLIKLLQSSKGIYDASKTFDDFTAK